jgi:hypothetical protein
MWLTTKSSSTVHQLWLEITATWPQVENERPMHAVPGRAQGQCERAERKGLPYGVHVWDIVGKDKSPARGPPQLLAEDTDQGPKGAGGVWGGDMVSKKRKHSALAV